jgi:IS5 family transposase
MLRTVGDQVSLWEAVLPDELRRLPGELARVDAWLDDPRFFAPFVPFFDRRIGRPSTPMETYLRLMFLKTRYRLGYESLCREVSDSITWRRFCRIPLEEPLPHPTTLMKLTTPLRFGCGGGAERDTPGEGGRAEAAALHPSPRRHHGGAGQCRLSDRLWAVGGCGAPDRSDRTADPGRRRRDPHHVAGSVPIGGSSGACDRLQTAVPGRRRQR